MAMSVSQFVGAYAVAGSEIIKEVYKKTLKEGGMLAQSNAERILPVFEKRLAGTKVNHVDATADKLVAQAVTEVRGGCTIGDILQLPAENVAQAYGHGLLLENIGTPEAAAYPEGMA
jgi:hypothetical protein